MRGPPIEPWEWTPECERVAQLIASGELNLNEIAAECEVRRETLWQWKRCPTFRARVHEHLEQVRKAMLRHTLVETDNQIALLTSRLAAIRGFAINLKLLRTRYTFGTERYVIKG